MWNSVKGWLCCILLCMVLMPDGLSSGNTTIACSLTFPNSVVTGQNTIYIPFRRVGRLIAVEAQVDTLAGIFLLDTGASDLLLNSSYFNASDDAVAEQARDVVGDMGTVAIQNVDTLFWDGLEISELEGHIVSLGHIEAQKNIRLIGILGFEVFKEFEILIDYNIRQLIVTRVDKKGNRLDPDAIFQQPIDSIDFSLIGHAIVMRGSVDGVKLRLALDTGAELNLLDLSVKRRVLDNFEIGKRVKMRGAGGNSVELIAGVLYNLELGIEQEIGMRTLLTRMWKVSDAMGTKLDGVLGYEFLFDKRTLINFKREKLYFFEPLKS